MKYVVCLHLYIPWKFGERGSNPRGARRTSLSFFCLFVCLFVCFFCPSRYDATHRKPRRCVYALNLGGTGISPPVSFSFSFSFHSRSSSTTSGDIFYCSGSRQLNHSSYSWDGMLSVNGWFVTDCQWDWRKPQDSRIASWVTCRSREITLTASSQNSTLSCRYIEAALLVTQKQIMICVW